MIDQSSGPQPATPSSQSGIPNAVEVAPCPFCGSPGTMIHPMGNWVSKEVGYGPDGSRITCSNAACPCMGRACYGPDQDAEAIAAWNTRVSTTEPGK